MISSARSGFDSGDFKRPDIGTFQEALGGLFSELFGFKSVQRPAPRDLTYDLEITFEEAALGVEKSFDFERRVVCERCGASGAEPGSHLEPCDNCQGRGLVPFRVGFFTANRTCPTCEGKKFEF